MNGRNFRVTEMTFWLRNEMAVRISHFDSGDMPACVHVLADPTVRALITFAPDTVAYCAQCRPLPPMGSKDGSNCVRCGGPDAFVGHVHQDEFTAAVALCRSCWDKETGQG